MRSQVLTAAKRLIVFILCLAPFAGNLFAQSDFKNPVNWSYQVTDAGNGEVNLVMTAKIDKDWHMDSKYPAKGGPLPTEFQ